MNRKDLERAVGDTAHAANDLGKEALAQATEYLQQAQEYLAPRAQDAIQQVGEYVTPRAQEAKKKGAKLAAQAMDAVQPALDDALERITPAVDEAYSKLAPALDAGRQKVQHEILPALSELLHDAADEIAKVEVAEVPAPAAKKRSGWKTFGGVVLAGGLLAAVVVALRKLFAPADSGWQAHEPSQPYVPTPPQTVVDEVAHTDAASEPAAADDVTTEDAAEQWLDDGGEVLGSDDPTEEPAGDTEGDAAPFADSPYGDGSYVGAEPPEGFVIKGNERSMKYHVPGGGGYERTIADVWFASEDAATAAGFTRAKR
ncbi:hypothetical protein [Propioniciclava sp.]|uniref:sunset domain-containing protein n=1 Tax=Propioniciclava sp. TaxID=2038686 RepID=UPI0039E2B2BC